MNDASNQGNLGAGLLRWTAGLLLFYLLSTGPVVKLACEHKISSRSIEYLYAPLTWLCETNIGRRTLAEALLWYGNTIWCWNLPPK